MYHSIGRTLALLHVDSFVPSVEIGLLIACAEQRTALASRGLFGKIPVMGERQNGPLGLHLHLDEKFTPGFPQAGLPLRLVLPGPLGTADWHLAAGTSRSKEHTPGDSTAALSPLERFKKALMAKQVASRSGKTTPIFGLDDTKLKRLPFAPDQRMRSDVAELFTGLWNELAKEYKERPDHTPGDSIGVASAYRSAKRDEIAWHNAFKKYDRDTLKQRLATGNRYGAKALKIMFNHMNGLKAPPGFSGHTHGIAADLTTTEKGQKWIVNSDYEHQIGWQKTWLYKWLVANASKHKFYQLKTETWHWEYHADDVPRQCWGGKVTDRPVKKPKPR